MNNSLIIKRLLPFGSDGATVTFVMTPYADIQTKHFGFMLNLARLLVYLGAGYLIFGIYLASLFPATNLSVVLSAWVSAAGTSLTIWVASGLIALAVSIEERLRAQTEDTD